jgi:uncharacterized membrane protein YdjX (TVP38/TMEM64 family)
LPAGAGGGDVNYPRRAVAGVAVAAVAAGALLVSPDAVLGRVEALAADPLAFGVALAALYAVRPFLAVPTTLCAVAVGYGYGVYGFPLALAGAALTSLPPFYLTRWTLGAGEGEGDADPAAGDRSGAVGWIAGSAERVRAAGREYFDAAGGVRGVTVARLAPIPADLVTCSAAATGVSVRAVVAGTLVGEVPWTAGAVLMGASAGRLAGAGDLSTAGTPVVLAALAGAAILLAGPAYRVVRASDRIGS